MYSKGNEEYQRFTKVLRKLNSSTQQIKNIKKNEDVLVGARHSALSSQKSTKNTSHLNKTPMEFEQAISYLIEPHEVLINRNVNTIRTQFIPTSKGFRFILLMEDNEYINLSWLHSIQLIERSKVLLLSYDVPKITKGLSPKILSLVIEFSHQKNANKFADAVTFIHSNYHDPDIQKLYHQLSSST